MQIDSHRRLRNRSWNAVRHAGLFACVIACGVLIAGEPLAQLVSGRAVGERVPQFFVRAVTGPLMNKSVCYVCRNGDRPVVMVLMRDVVDGVPALLKEIDRCVDQHRAVGLRGFGVLLTENQRTAISKLQTLSFDNQLSLPLTVASTQLDAPSSQNLHPDAAVTVVLYHDQTVITTHAFRDTELTSERISQLMSSVKELAAKGH
ncbi:MAG: hypothetical protein JWN70_3513 [Planctomycetaceae bacterium]|nr:hypothetical protein [Planctomycetaceae bacterium]